MKRLIFTLFIFSFLQAQAQIKVSSGSIKRFVNFKSDYIQARNIDVWLPQNYNPNKKYAVLYMHDGQMLFDSTATWNHQEWGVDETLSALLKAKKIKDCMVVGIWNNGKYRHTDYFPEKPLAFLEANHRDSLIKEELQGKPLADEYLLFLTKELKPFIDSHFATYTNRENTFIAGSSMGGLISIYALCEYPEIFCGAACLSTHWVGSLKKIDGTIPAAFNQYLDKKLPAAKTHKIYFDYGSKTLDSLYKPYQTMVDETLKKHGYNQKNWLTKEFIGADHSEKSWKSRLALPMLFLLKI